MKIVALTATRWAVVVFFSGLPWICMAMSPQCIPDPPTDEEIREMAHRVASLQMKKLITRADAKKHMDEFLRRRMCKPIRDEESFRAGFREGRQLAESNPEIVKGSPTTTEVGAGYSAGYSDGKEAGKREICSEVEWVDEGVAEEAGC